MSESLMSKSHMRYDCDKARVSLCLNLDAQTRDDVARPAPKYMQRKVVLRAETLAAQATQLILCSRCARNRTFI